MVSRLFVLMVSALVFTSSASAQGNSIRDKLNSAADRACVLATHLQELCGSLQNDRAKFNVKRLIGAVCKPNRAEQRVAIEKRYLATFGASGDRHSCSARANAFQRIGAEMRSIATTVEERRPKKELPTG